ncbi:MAG: hypothetical protein V1773_01170 [bacterium]
MIVGIMEKYKAKPETGDIIIYHIVLMNYFASENQRCSMSVTNPKPIKREAVSKVKILHMGTHPLTPSLGNRGGI